MKRKSSGREWNIDFFYRQKSAYTKGILFFSSAFCYYSWCLTSRKFQVRGTRCMFSANTGKLYELKRWDKAQWTSTIFQSSSQNELCSQFIFLMCRVFLRGCCIHFAIFRSFVKHASIVFMLMNICYHFKKFTEQFMLSSWKRELKRSSGYLISNFVYLGTIASKDI